MRAAGVGCCRRRGARLPPPASPAAASCACLPPHGLLRCTLMLPVPLTADCRGDQRYFSTTKKGACCGYVCLPALPPPRPAAAATSTGCKAAAPFLLLVRCHATQPVMRSLLHCNR